LNDPGGGFTSIRHLFDRGPGRASELLNFWISRTQSFLWLFLSLHLRIRLVGIFAFPQGLQNARGVPFRKLDLLEHVGLRSTPFMGEIEKCGGCVKRVGCLPAVAA
jgi:hypothetical protein